jgi:hypothetical protein
MNDETLHQLLNDADAQFQAGQPFTSTDSGMSMVAAIRRRRVQQLRRRTGLGVLAVLIIVGGVSAWVLNDLPWNGARRAGDTIASNPVTKPVGAESRISTNESPQVQRLRPDEIKRLQAEIAALDAEANRARRMVALYREAEARRERLAALDAAPAEPLLSPEALTELAIDRAAAVTVTSADVQANQFNRLAEAAESYTSVLTLFPSSRWAGVARERLETMQQMN